MPVACCDREKTLPNAQWRCRIRRTQEGGTVSARPRGIGDRAGHAAPPCGGGAGNRPQDRARPDGRRGAEPLAALVRLHLVGRPGTGKSHLSLALGIEAVKAGRSVYFTTLADLVGALAKAEREGTPSSRSDLFDKRAPPVAPSLGFSSTVALE